MKDGGLPGRAMSLVIVLVLLAPIVAAILIVWHILSQAV